MSTPLDGIELLSQDEILRLRKAVGSENDLVVFVGEWLSHLRTFSDAQIYDILRFSKEMIERRSDSQGSSEFDCALVLMDYRWVSISGKNSVWDVKRMDELPHPPIRPITYVTCDIMGLREHMTHREQQIRVFDPQTERI